MHSVNLLKIVLLALTIAYSPLSCAEEEDEQASQPAMHGVTLERKAQLASGIKTQVVYAQSLIKEFTTMGKVLNVEPLLTLRSRYQVAQAELKSAEARLAQSTQTLTRQQNLFHDGVVAKKSLQELRAQLVVEQAAVDASQARIMAIVNEVRINWGNTLAQWVIADSAAKLKPLLMGKQHLLQISVPVDRKLARSTQRIFVESVGDRKRAEPAVFISKAPQMDANIQGVNYFFVNVSDTLQVGMKITAWLPETNVSVAGVLIPETALVWYMDQLFVYVKTDENHFHRQRLSTYTRTDKGYVVQGGLRDGDEIAVIGGQSLLSEEMRQQIPDEDD